MPTDDTTLFSLAPGGERQTRFVEDPAAALKSVLASFEASHITNVELGAPPADRQGNGTWLYFSVSLTTTHPSEPLVARWEAATIAADVAELVTATSDLSDGIAGFTVSMVQPDGKELSADDITLGHIASGQVFAPANSESLNHETVTELLEKNGLRTSKIEVTNPLDPVLIVEAVLDDGGTIESLDQMLADLTQQSSGVEGVVLTIVDNAGGVLAVSVGAHRAGYGGRWVAPGTEGRFGLPDRALPNG